MHGRDRVPNTTAEKVPNARRAPHDGLHPAQQLHRPPLTHLPGQSHLRESEVLLDLLEHVLPVPMPSVGVFPHLEHTLALPELSLRPGGRQFQQGDVAVGSFYYLVG